jgi:LysR family transcriptional regulator, glycine cleavage system transcriptional activator
MQSKVREKLPPLNNLRVFEVVARHLSISRAANELNVTPGAVSRQLTALESFLGTQLFSRKHRDLILTKKGRDYYEDISKSLSEIKSSTKRLFSERNQNQLKVRCYTTFSIRWLIPRLSSFLALYPKMEVVLTTSMDPVNFDQEDLDCAIRLGDGAWSDANVTRLVSNIILPVCSPSLLASSSIKNLQDFGRYKLLDTISRPDDWNLWFKSIGMNVKLEDFSRLSYESSALCYSAAIEGHGIAMAQYFLVESELRDGKLACPFHQFLNRESFTYYLLTPLGKNESQQAKDFRTWLLKEIRNCSDTPSPTPS